VLNKSISNEFKDLVIAKTRWGETSNPSRRFRLKRNIHRLEKGLIHPNRRPIFGLGYIDEIFSDFQFLMERAELGNSDSTYVISVLQAYDNATSLPESIQNRLNTLLKNRESNTSCSPYDFSTLEPVDSPQHWNHIVRNRRSVRYFLPEKLSTELVQSIINDAIQSPSPCNRNCIQYHVITSNEKIMSVGTIVGGARGFMSNVPCLIAITGDALAYPGFYDRHARYIETGLQAMTLMYSATARGLATCPINWPRIASSDNKAKSILQLNETERITMLVALGYAADNCQVAYSGKGDVKDKIILQ
jgi:nitroreductase